MRPTSIGPIFNTIFHTAPTIPREYDELIGRFLELSVSLPPDLGQARRDRITELRAEVQERGLAKDLTRRRSRARVRVDGG
jgi:hypothetical protein